MWFLYTCNNSNTLTTYVDSLHNRNGIWLKNKGNQLTDVSKDGIHTYRRDIQVCIVTKVVKESRKFFSEDLVRRNRFNLKHGRYRPHVDIRTLEEMVLGPLTERTQPKGQGVNDRECRI